MLAEHGLGSKCGEKPQIISYLPQGGLFAFILVARDRTDWNINSRCWSSAVAFWERVCRNTRICRTLSSCVKRPLPLAYRAICGFGGIALRSVNCCEDEGEGLPYTGVQAPTKSNVLPPSMNTFGHQYLTYGWHDITRDFKRIAP